MPYTIALLVSLWSAPLTVPVPHAVPLPPALPPTDSIRPDTEIRLAVLRHAAEVRRCYESEGLRRDPRLNGSVELEITIQPTGVVSRVAVRTDSLIGTGAPEVGKCLATIARHWRFDRGPYGVETVVLPFVLTPNADAQRRAIIGAEQ
jgi:hypothetical protein